MADISERFVTVAGGACRVLEKGQGLPVGVIAGHGGIPRWCAFLDELAKSRRVVLLSPPGFCGSDPTHQKLDGHLDWIAATLDLIEGAGLAGCDLVAASVGGMLAADATALSNGLVRRLSLAAPYGLFDVADPGLDVFAQTPDELVELLSAHRDRYDAVFTAPEDADPAAWQMRQYRAAIAAVRVLWPLGDRGLAKRLHRIRAPVQLLWGRDDRLVPPSYAARFQAGLGGESQVTMIDDAAHLVWIDQPALSASAVLEFLDA